MTGGAAIRLVAVLLQVFDELTPEERYRAAYSLFRGEFTGRGAFLPILILFAAIPLVLWLVYRLQRRRQGVVSSRPLLLLWVLSGKASLGLFDRLLLLRVARQTAQPNPAAILFSANVYDRLTGQWTHGRVGRPVYRLTRIRDRLFGAQAAPDAAGEPAIPGEKQIPWRVE